jgi:hypothetical protein
MVRRILFVLIAAGALGACASMYDDEARRECDRTTRASERGECYDQVDQRRRERDD